MIDVKKLITGFLILAVAAVCSGLIFSLVNFSSPTTANAGDGITIGADTAVADNTDAFLPTEAQVQEVAATLAPNLASSTMLVSSTDPTNLTDDLAAEFVNGVVAANPNGPTGTDASGNPTFGSPDVNAIAASIADSTTTQNVQIPNWDVEAESIPVTVAATSSVKAMVSYAVALNDALVSHFNNPQVANIIGDQSDSLSDMAYMESQTQEALQDIASLKTPAPAVAYQKSLLTELVYEKNMIQLNSLAQTDPIKASIIFQQEDQKFSSVQQNLQDQGNAIATKNLSFQEAPPNDQNVFLSFLYDTFAVPQAHAQLDMPELPAPPVPVPLISPGIGTMNVGQSQQEADEAAQSQWQQELNNLEQEGGNIQAQTNATSLFSLLSSIHLQNEGDKLEALLKNTLLQILKNTLVAIIQREVLTWIQGSGAPRFITNWGTQLVNAAQTSALNAINAKMSCGVFPSFIPQIKVTLNAFYKSGNNSCANQFAAALGSNSFQQFYNNFANGGFVAFGASTLPSGNPYGSLFFNAQTVSVAYNNQQAASGLQAQSSQGLNSSLVCGDTSNPSGQHTMCESTMGNTNGDDYLLTGSLGTCGSGFAPVVYDNNGLCADGSQPQVTTPAAATGFVLQSGIDATPKQLAAANDITGVLNSVLNSLLTSLASTAVNAAGKIVNQALTSINGSNITNGTAATAATFAVSTSTATGTISATGAAGTIMAAGSPTATPLTCNPSLQTLPPVSQTVPTVSVSQSSTTTSSYSTPTSTAPVSISASGGTLDVNDNAPSYYWSASNGVTNTGSFFSDTFTIPGTYTVTLGDSMDDASTTCTVIQQ